MLRTHTTAVAAAALGLASLALAPAAGAAPARTGTATFDKPYTYTGAAITGVSASSATLCSTPMSCDDTLVNLPAADVAVTLGNASAGGSDLDLYVYTSNAAGDAINPVASSSGGTADELAKFTTGAPGMYLVRVAAATAVQSTFDVKVAVTPPANPVPASGKVEASTGPNAPGAAAVPPQKVIVNDPDPTSPAGSGTGSDTGSSANKAPLAKVTHVASRNVRVLKGTAADSDGKVGSVRVALVKLGAGVVSCSQLTSTRLVFKALKTCAKPTTFLLATGHVNWSLKLAKALPKGNYVVYAQAIDAKGLKQSGFKGTARRTFTIR